MENGYTETDLRAYFLSRQAPKAKGKHLFPTQNRAINLLIDIQNKLQSKGPGYRRWASIYNLKQMSKTLLFLRDHKIESMEQLSQSVAQITAQRDALLASIQKADNRLSEIAALKKHIINYSKTIPRPARFMRNTAEPVTARSFLRLTAMKLLSISLLRLLSMS